jgi:steroid 5-alpha reductase family enzyme
MNTSVWLYSFLCAVALFQIVSIPALIMKKNDLADVLWGPAFPLAAAAGFYGAGGTHSTRTMLLLGLVCLWALRLFFHVGIRNLAKKEEDVRYNNWRKQWGKTQVWRSYLQVFVLQPLILYVFLIPMLLGLASPAKDPSLLTWIGVIVWCIGFFFEAVGDEQLRRFKANPANKGKMMTSGLWSLSRHPNYFGEVTLWWGVWLMVLDLPYGWATIIGPIGVSYLLWNVSGVSMLEDLMRVRPGFAEYAKRTSIFFPRPPRA